MSAGLESSPPNPFLHGSKAERENRSLDAVTVDGAGFIPLGRQGEAEEYGAVVAFLASR